FGAGPITASLGAIIAAQPALLYGYAQMGAVKELGAACMIPLALCTALLWVEHRGHGARTVVPLAVTLAAAAGVVGVVVGVWLIPLLLGTGIVAALNETANRRVIVRHAVVLAVVAAVLAFQTLLSMK